MAWVFVVGCAIGSSPRRRGAPWVGAGAGRDRGIIPAQAGSTRPVGGWTGCRGDHPRAGGEHQNPVASFSTRAGSSPRRRGAHEGLAERLQLVRIIPAQAGSTSSRTRRRSEGRDHPRAGGEHWPSSRDGTASMGSSPGRRGARSWVHRDHRHRGIIPAQAGSTLIGLGADLAATGSSPRRREHGAFSESVSLGLGSSPRRRGARHARVVHAALVRIIPAQAGSTRSTPRSAPSLRDHPRAGGEHDPKLINGGFSEGSSPRRRGAHACGQLDGDGSGIIPAQAGSTVRFVGSMLRFRDHPRAGGEHILDSAGEPANGGSSPRRRGAQHVLVGEGHAARIIPAQAGSTL